MLNSETVSEIASYFGAPACKIERPSQPIDLRNFRTLIAITTGIIQRDKGSVPYAPQVIAEGVQMAVA